MYDSMNGNSINYQHSKTYHYEDEQEYTLNLFKRYFEKYYTTDLEQYKFDKTECKACVHNAANYNLFAEHNGCGHCTNRKCLEAKNAAYVAKETEKLLKSDPKLVVARPYYGSRNDMALQKLDRKGHEIKELDYNVSAREFPKAPEAPKKERFTEPKEYEQAVEIFERRNEEYARKVEELGRMKEEGRIKTYVKVGQTEPELCYVEINRKETAPVTIGTLQERDKRFKQLSIEKIVADTKKNDHVPETTSGISFSPPPREQRAGPDDPTHTATVKPFKIPVYEVYKNSPECGVFHRQGFFP